MLSQFERFDIDLLV